MTLTAQPLLPFPPLCTVVLGQRQATLRSGRHCTWFVTHRPIVGLSVSTLWQVELHHGQGTHQLAAAAEHQSACGQVPGGV